MIMDYGFDERDEILLEMGFSSYEEYLKSALWDWIKETMMQHDHHKQCRCCRSVAGLIWHHISYSLPTLVGNFSSTSAIPITRICNRCHEFIHKADGKWVSLKEARDRLHALLRCKGNYDKALSDLACLKSSAFDHSSESDSESW